MTRSTKCFLILGSLTLAACARQDTTRAGSGSTANTRAGMEPGSMESGRQQPQSMGMEAELLRRIHMVNGMEIQAGEVAKERAQSQQVKDYAERMIREHRQADERLTQLAQRRGVDFGSMEMQHTSGQNGMTSGHSGEMHGGSSMEMPADMQQSMQEMERLRSLRGREFDVAYMQQMVKDHANTLQMLESSLERVQDPMLKNELSTLVTSVRSHRDLAQSILGQLGDDRKNIRGSEQQDPTQPQRR